MSEDNDFFGDVFDDPDDDPLLSDSPEPTGEAPSENADCSSEPDRTGPAEEQGPPSWMSEEPNENGSAPHSPRNAANGRQHSDSTRKQIVVDQQGDAGAGIDALNQAVGQGWRLVRIFLARPDGEQAETSKAARRFVAILEQDRPQSLFDF